ncbi:MAG: SCP2 sterol-binding domain-containing protein [Lachnospiraceae bacterium]
MTYQELVEELRKLYEVVDASAIEEHFAIQINIDGEAEGALYIEFADGQIEVQPYEYYDRDIIINTDFETAIDLANGDIGMFDAYAEEKISAWGDLDKAIEIYEAIFGKSEKRKKIYRKDNR